MRTDCVIDTNSIACPNASRLGSNLPEANVGNLVVYLEHYEGGATGERAARVLGRVSAAPSGQTPAVEGFALVMALSDDCTHVYERWIDPADIVQVRAVPTQLLEFFARPELPPVGELRKKMEAGYVCENYLAQSGL